MPLPNYSCTPIFGNPHALSTVDSSYNISSTSVSRDRVITCCSSAFSTKSALVRRRAHSDCSLTQSQRLILDDLEKMAYVHKNKSLERGLLPDQHFGIKSCRNAILRALSDINRDIVYTKKCSQNRIYTTFLFQLHFQPLYWWPSSLATPVPVRSQKLSKEGPVQCTELGWVTALVLLGLLS